MPPKKVTHGIGDQAISGNRLEWAPGHGDVKFVGMLTMYMV